MKRVSKSLQETKEIAREFLNSLGKSDSDGAEVAGLSGDLGAGKTTFVQAIGQLLKVKEPITSPTFVIEKIYPIKHPQFDRLIHIDAYRLEKGEELLKLGFPELANNPKNLILIEWPENVRSALPKNFHQIHFQFIDENTREINA